MRRHRCKKGTVTKVELKQKVSIPSVVKNVCAYKSSLDVSQNTQISEETEDVVERNWDTTSTASVIPSSISICLSVWLEILLHFLVKRVIPLSSVLLRFVSVFEIPEFEGGLLCSVTESRDVSEKRGRLYSKGDQRRRRQIRARRTRIKTTRLDAFP